MDKRRLHGVLDVLMRVDRLHEDAAVLFTDIQTMEYTVIDVRGDRLPPQTDVLLNDLELVLGGLDRCRERIYGVIIHNVLRGEQS